MPLPLVVGGLAMGIGRRMGLHAGKSLIAAAGRHLGATAGRSFGKIPKRRRTRGMHLRRGRLFLGFTQKEVKNAMRRQYGGHRRK